MKKTHILVLFVLLGLSFSVISLTGHSNEAVPAVAPSVVLDTLKKGNGRFVEGKTVHPSQDAKRRQELTKGQHPSAIVLSCSDSRVPPELVFDQGLGDLFTVRVAGNVLGADEVASMEYAVEHLGASVIVVMGHESCGAVKAAIQTPKGEKVGSADLSALVATIHQNWDATGRKIASSTNAAADKTLREPVKANVNGVVRNLLARSKLIAERVKSGTLKISSAIYSLDSGKVDFWE